MMRLPHLEFRLQKGYILVITVLFVGAILIATTTSLLLLGWAAEQNGVVEAQTTQSLEAARGCMDLAFYKLREDTTYGGNETIVLPNSLGQCSIYIIQGSGMNRTICTDGVGGSTTRRLRAIVTQLYPKVIIESYEEISSRTQCGGILQFSSSSASSSPPGSSSSSVSSVAASSAASSIASSAGSSAATSSAASSAAASCGNASCDAGNGETCDDGNTNNGDGCSASCQVESNCNCGSCAQGFRNAVCTCEYVIFGSSSSAGTTSSSSSAATSSSSSVTGFCGDNTCQSGLGETCDLGLFSNGTGIGCDGSCHLQAGCSCSPACGAGLQSCSCVSSSSSSSTPPSSSSSSAAPSSSSSSSRGIMPSPGIGSPGIVF